MNSPKFNRSRRDFIRVSSLAGGGFVLSLALPGPGWAQASPAPEASPADFAPSPFLRITSAGVITLLAPNPETGQGVRTSLPMMIAEELDVDMASVVVEQASLRADVGGQFAAGSGSTPGNFMRLRRAGATARAMLVEAAAQRWKVPTSELRTEKGQVLHDATGRALAYGALAATAALLPIPAESTIRLKPSREFRVMGSRVGGVDNRAIVTGQPLFGIDQKLPGMVYAVFAKCPVFGGKVIRANVEHIKSLPDVIDCFVIEGSDNPSGLLPGVAIIARSTWASFSAKRQLQVEWDESAGAHHTSAIYASKAADRARSPGANLRTDGDVAAAFASAATVIEAAYAYPFLNHATLEPQGCTAWATGDGIEFWTTSQSPEWGRELVAKTLTIPPEKLKMNLVRGGGGFGRRLSNDALVEAAALALRTGGKPVKLTWTREDDMRHCFYRPGGFHFLKGAIDAQGRLSAWHNHFVTFGHWSARNPANCAGIRTDELPARFVANYKLDQSILHTIVPTGLMRAPGANAMAFVMQGFIDELAHAARRDPVEFRLELLGEDRIVPCNPDPFGEPYDTGRMKAVLRRVAAESTWGESLSPGEGRGVAFHFCHSGYVAMVAQVAVSKEGGLRIRRVTAVVDVGPIINLSGAENQVQGAIIDGLSTLWLQEMTYEQGRAVQGNFNDYPLLRINDAPERITIHFIQNEIPPTGLGEPPYPVITPAVCNAIFAATGKRVRQLPLVKSDLRWS
ncbi:MAG: molybdopterin cofactor-binding domain-containing protein [Opitutaceae bacterium]